MKFPFLHMILSTALVLLLLTTHAQLVASQADASTYSLNKASILVDPHDHEVVRKAAELLQQDILLITGEKLPIIRQPQPGRLIIIGSADRSAIIRHLNKKRKLNSAIMEGRWEAFHISSIKNPYPAIPEALVISGSDARGTAFGVLELSRQAGVSPWYWWADVPLEKKKSIHIKRPVSITDSPLVKYRGIFLNDEAPALSNWSRMHFSGFRAGFYEKIFELMLRLKANYIWPAMWGNAFYDDDSLNIRMAERYAIVIGTSHHEPLMRAHDEWRRYGNHQLWNYDSSKTALLDFWRKGLARARNEKIVTIGMRGDGDEPMSRETATQLLERIVADQRNIISEVTGKPAAQTPQLWAQYKEVQDYYDKGMRVPDDVTLLLCDDNWGNIRRLPPPDAPKRNGGYGIYYHFDYVGGPRNYKWINTNPLPRVWEQLHLAWEYDVKQIWIVNVGDLKPMELPISFFLDYAWNPTRIGPSGIQAYTEQWAAEQFGDQHRKEIARLLAAYTKITGRKKPELLDENTYYLSGGNAFSSVIEETGKMEKDAKSIAAQLPAEYQSAYFQLVLHPITAVNNLHQLYYYTALNQHYAKYNLAIANRYADTAKQKFENDSLISLQYHRINNGKWNHMMSQTHIGYTHWQQPPYNKMPALKYLETPEEDQLIHIDTIATTSKDLIPPGSKGHLFYQYSGYVSMDAAHYTKATNSHGITWTILPDHGRSSDAVTPFPVKAPRQYPGGNAPRLSYDFYVRDAAAFELSLYCSPTLNLQHAPEGLQFAVSIDDQEPQIMELNKDDHNTKTWESWVANNIIIKKIKLNISKPGKHTLHYWMVDPGIVLQKLELNAGKAKPGYLGFPETIYR